MEPSKAEAWRELGFFHEFDSDRRVWRIRGTTAGLGRLISMLATTAPSRGEHVAIGPHRDLLCIESERRFIDEDGLHGRADDFRLLAMLIEQKLSRAEPGDEFVVDKQFAPGNRVPIELEVEEDDFDPGMFEP